MAVVAVGTLRGSPGATTLALDLASTLPGTTLLVEADPDGGCLAARLDLALAPGLTELAGAARAGIATGDLWRFAQPARSGIAVVVAHPAPERVHASLTAAARHIAGSLSSLADDVVVDCGRLRAGSPALVFASSASRTIVLCSNDLETGVALAHREPTLGALAPVLTVLTGSRTFARGEIAAACGREVWGTVPDTGQLDRIWRPRRASARRRTAIESLCDECWPGWRTRGTGDGRR